MRKLLLVLLFAAFAVAGPSPRTAFANGQEKATAAPKQSRWHGLIVRINKDASTIVVRKGNVDRTIHYDSSTKWTRGTKAVDMSEFKEGADVICLGTYPAGSVEMNATRIDLRSQ